MAQVAKEEPILPQLITQRWSSLKTEMHKLCERHRKEDLILKLMELREHHTAAPTLSEITKLTGFDVSIHTIQNWDWKPTNKGNIDLDAQLIGDIGAELMVLHAIRESVRNSLLVTVDDDLELTPMGQRHFETVNSFNVDITGDRMDIAKKRFSVSRMSKSQREMDPINQLRSVRELYWKNSIIMLLRAPLPFYRSMKLFSQKEVDVLIEIMNKLSATKQGSSSGLKKIIVPIGSKPYRVLYKLLPEKDKDRRPKFVGAMMREIKDNKVEFTIGLGALTMFIMFLQGFKREQLDEKARRAEEAVRDVIEYSNYWEVIDTNTEIVDEGGETVTEIDIIARSKKDPSQWVHCEVKDFSYWRGWIFGRNIEIRRQYYEKAVTKLPVKEQYIKDKYQCEKIRSFIVTSIPEAFEEIDGVSLVYLSDLREVLAKINQRDFTPRRKYSSQNFLIRYFWRLKNDYEASKELQTKQRQLKKRLSKAQKEVNEVSSKLKEKKALIDKHMSKKKTLKVSQRLAKRRLVKDDGTKHFQLEEEIKSIERELSKVGRELKVCMASYKELMLEYRTKDDKVKKIEKELERMESKLSRLLVPRAI